MNTLSRTLSWFFIPLNAPVIALAIVAYMPAYDPDTREVLFLLQDQWKELLLLLFAFFSIIIPSFTILFLKFSGAVSTVMMDNRKERTLPSIFVNVSAIALYFMLRSKDPYNALPTAIYALAIGSFLTVFICTVITQWWKVSLHAAGMGIITGFLLAYYSNMMLYDFWMLPVTLVASGVVMSARMYLGKHNLAQCLVGYLIGTTMLATCVLLFHH